MINNVKKNENGRVKRVKGGRKKGNEINKSEKKTNKRVRRYER